MTAATPAQLSALLGSRICHDLVSPLGAIGNGVELLQMMGDHDSPEMSLVSESVETAAARVKLFRLAFGAAAADQSVAASEMREHAAQLGNGRFQAIWTADGDVDRQTAKLGLLLLLCAETLMPYGGEARAEAKPDTIRVIMSAKRMRDAETLLAHLDENDTPLPPASEIHFLLARCVADEMQRTLAVTQKTADRIEITV